MKGSINPGGVKDGSASVVKALSGAPKCALIGEKDITYNFNVTYAPTSQGTLGIQLSNLFPETGISSIDPPKPYPYGKWVLDITYVGLAAIIPFPIKFGMAQIVDYNGRLGVGHAGDNIAEFLVATTVFSHVTLNFSDGTPHAARFYDSWLLVNGQFLDFKGPDLFSFLTLDFSGVGTITKRVVLPEQLDYCDSYFIPYIFAPLNLGVNPPRWTPLSNQFGQIAPAEIDSFLVGANQYPVKTKIGTLQMRFRRTETEPLFTYTTTAPGFVNFINKTLFNPALAPVWDWDFGDGSAHSALMNPSHNYTNSGKYVVKLKSTDAAGKVKSIDQIVDFSLHANYTFAPPRQTFVGGVRFMLVAFTDQSIGVVTSWDWDFGDGSAHGTTANPTHNYAPGAGFNCKLTVHDALGGSSTITKVIST